MPSLSHKRLHGRAHMLRALTAAGQFAHLSTDDISEALDELYNIEYRLRLGDKGSHELAAPLALVKARESRLFDEPHYDARTVDHVALLEGVCCCLCLRVDRPCGPRESYAIPKGFVTYVCPTFLRAEGRPKFDDQPPLCLPCRQALANRLWREYGAFSYRLPDEEPLWAALLAWLAGNRTFRDRVLENAPHRRTLRFDPRRIELPLHRRKAA